MGTNSKFDTIISRLKTAKTNLANNINKLYGEASTSYGFEKLCNESILTVEGTIEGVTKDVYKTKVTDAEGNETVQKTVIGLLFNKTGEYVVHPALTSISPIYKPQLNSTLIKKLTIPDGITEIQDAIVTNGYPKGCFYYLGVIKDVYLSQTLTKIGSYAFYVCSSLKNIEFPKSLKEIGDYAFLETKITTAEFSNGLTTIGKEAFRSCANLVKVIIPETVTSIGENAFLNINSQAQIYVYNNEGAIPGAPWGFSGTITYLGSSNALIVEEDIENKNSAYSFFEEYSSKDTVIVKSSCKKIGNYAFNNGSNIKNIIFEEGLEEIGSYAFRNCRSLTKVVLPNSCTKIGRGAFLDAYNIKSMVLPDNLEEIPDEFKRITNYSANNAYIIYNLTSINWPSNLKRIGISAFTFNNSLTFDSFPNSLSCIDDYAFYVYSWGGSSNRYINGSQILREKITFNESLCKIGNYAFHGFFTNTSCYNNFDLVIPEKCTQIGSYAFSGANLVFKSITINSNSTYNDENNEIAKSYIGSYAFNAYYPTITSIYIKNDIKLYNSCFKVKYDYLSSLYRYSTLTYLNISNCTNIEASAFQGHTKLKEVYLADELESCGYDVFKYVSCLTNAKLPINAGPYFYVNCYNLTSFTLPEGTTKIGDGAFCNCYNLGTNQPLYLNDNISSVGRDAFSYTAFTELHLGKSLKEVGQAGFYNLKRCTAIDFGEGERITVGANAFANYPLLKQITADYNRIGDVNGIFSDYLALTDVKLNNYTNIAESAFYNCGCLSNIDLTESNINYIGSYAFAKCTNLSNLDFFKNSQVTGIYSYAFASCVNLTSISGLDFDSVTVLSSYVFNNCVQLTGTFINGRNTQLAGGIFKGSYFTVLDFTKNNFSELPYYNGLNMFENLSNVNYIYFPDTLTKIGATRTFYGCINLKGIQFPTRADETKTVIKLDADEMFQDCQSLISLDEFVFEPYDLTSYLAYTCRRMFKNCFSLTHLPKFSDSIKNVLNKLDIRYCTEMFRDCKSLSSFEFPACTGSLDARMFYGCEKLSSIIFPKYCTSHYGYWNYNDGQLCGIWESDSQYIVDCSHTGRTFQNCTSLTSVIFEGDITVIPPCMFENCYNLKTVQIGENSKYKVCSYAFKECYNLETLNCKNITAIGTEAFYNCKKLKSSNIEEINAQKIYNRAFYNCESFTDLKFKYPINLVSTQTFYNCQNLQNIEFVPGTSAIPNETFYNCFALNNVKIPYTLTSIGNNAFYMGGAGSIIEVDNDSEDVPGVPWGSLGQVEWNTSRTHKIIDENPVEQAEYYNYSAENPRILQIKLLNKEVNEDGVYTNPITSIGARAFQMCNNVKTVHIPNTVLTIGEDAFKYMPTDSVIYINNIEGSITGAPWGSLGLIQWLGNSNDPNTTYLAFNDGTIETRDIEGTATWENIGVKKTEISRNETLTYCKLSEKVTDIDTNTFYLCSTLTSIDIPNSVTSLGDNTFLCCYQLQNVTIPDSISSLGTNTFVECSSLTSVTLGNNLIEINERAFYNCINLQNVTVGSSVSSIGSSAFYNCSSLTSINIQEACTTIENEAFANCSSLLSLFIPENISYIGANAYINCNSITSLTFENKYISEVQEMENYPWGLAESAITVIWTQQQDEDKETVLTFSDGTTQNLYIEDTLTWENLGIKSTSADTDESLVSLKIGNIVSSINDYAIYNHRGLTSIDIPSSVTSIGVQALANCSSLTSIDIPNTVTYIGQYALDSLGISSFTLNCPITEYNNIIRSTSLVDVDLRNTSLTSLSPQAFMGSNISSIYLPDTITSIGTSCFAACFNLENINIPKQLTGINQSTFFYNIKLQHIIIPSSVTSIASPNFFMCNALTCIAFENRYLSDVQQICKCYNVISTKVSAELG